MKTRFYNAYILTMEDEKDIIYGEIWVEDDKIVYIGKDRIDCVDFDQQIDVKGNIIMPG